METRVPCEAPLTIFAPAAVYGVEPLELDLGGRVVTLERVEPDGAWYAADLQPGDEVTPPETGWIEIGPARV